MIALHNSAAPNFTPPEVDLEADLDFSKAPEYRLEDLVAGITKENRHAEVNWGTPMGALTLKAASIVLPLLKAKKVTPKMILKMLEEILRVRARLKALEELAAQAQELKIGYGKDDPVPSVFDKIRAFHARRRRRKRVLLPEFKKLMSKKPAGNTQADLDAVRGDR